MSKWISTSDKMPNIGDYVYVTDGYETHKIIVRHMPENPLDSNVIYWRYVENE